MIYTILIKETLEKVVTVKAESKKEALQVANTNYCNAEDGYILSGDDLAESGMEIIDA